MKEIIYKFQDGTRQTVKVQDDFYKNYELMEKENKKQDRKETRRHIPLSFFVERGVEFKDESFDLENSLINEEIKFQIKKAIKTLTQKQQKIVQKIFFEGMKASEIAKEWNINKSVITRQLCAIYSHLREYLKNF